MALRIVLSIVVALVSLSFGWRDNEMEIKMSNLTKSQLARLRALNLDGDVWQNGNAAKATMYAIPSELSGLDAAGLSYTITIADMKEHYKDFWAKRKTHGAHSDAYHSAAEIISLMDSLVTAFPSICKKIKLGTSNNGVELSMLKISKNVSVHENEAQICFDGGIHGDEIGGPENLIRFARLLCTSYATDTAIASLINSREIFLYCMVNPDGRVKNDRGNYKGIDCNRNHGYMWSAEDTSTAPYSEPETKALRTAISANRFAIQISYHSGTIEILYPWGWSGTANPDQAHHKKLSSLYMSSSGYSGSYKNCSSFDDYPTHGETVDYTYGAMGAVGLTFELSENKEPPADSISYYYNLNLPAMKKMIEYAGYGIAGLITDSANGNPVAATIYAGSSFPFYSDSGLGDYHKFVNAGTYSLVVSANGYISKTVSVTAQDAKTTTTNITLKEDTSARKCYGYRVICIDSASGNTYSALGAPDSKTCILRKGSIDSVIGITIDLQYPVVNATGNEIFVYISGTTSTYTCYAGQSPDGPWKSLGTGTKTDSFDLATGSLTTARYVRIIGKDCGIDAVAGSWAYNFDTKVKEGNYASNKEMGIMTAFSANGKVRLQLKGADNCDFKIFDARGRCRFASSFKSGICDWPGASHGVYMLETYRKGHSSPYRFVVK
jgi:hypothetical protein